MARNPARQKPAKPYTGYPLTPHNGGQWCKKIHGKLWYFGPWEDPEGALERYVQHRDAGSLPTTASTIDTLCQRYLHSKKLMVDSGQLTQATWNDARKECKRLIAHFGRSFPLDKLNPWHLEQYRAKWPRSWAPATVQGRLARTCAILRYAYAQQLVAIPIPMGDALAKPTRRQMQAHKANRPERYFERDEIYQLLAFADDTLAAMVLLGLNCGFGNADCGRLEWAHVDFRGHWYRQPRGKTGEWREAWLWPETVNAIHMGGTRGKGLVFRTQRGNPWYVDGANNSPISLAFSRVATAAGCRRKGVNFYSLRHVFQTIAEETGDMVAVHAVMGHHDASISATYRQRIAPERIKAVCSHVRDWFLGCREQS